MPEIRAAEMALPLLRLEVGGGRATLDCRASTAKPFQIRLARLIQLE